MVVVVTMPFGAVLMIASLVGWVIRYPQHSAPTAQAL
jgi:hypothetical protein